MFWTAVELLFVKVSIVGNSRVISSKSLDTRVLDYNAWVL